MFQSNFSKHFSGDFILMVTYIINRLPSSVINWKTPFELLYNKKTNYDYLKVFGCFCYITNTLSHKDKFALYSPEQKAYKVYDIIS